MTPDAVDISIIIVNFNVKYFVEQCLRSVAAASEGVSVEVFVVDNGSTDGSLEYLRPLFPTVRFIDNITNSGFGSANNVAMKISLGRYLLILNPDTLIGSDSLRAMVKYMDDNPQVGASGPKILTRTGEFDRTCKRGLPTPWVGFCRLSGLSRLFPQSRLFGKYDLLYLDSDTPAEVDALSG
jgi:GT2 family glycosyltransferase